MDGLAELRLGIKWGFMDVRRGERGIFKTPLLEIKIGFKSYSCSPAFLFFLISSAFRYVIFLTLKKKKKNLL